MVVSREFCADASVAGVLEGFSPVLEQAVLKGFDGPVAYFRIIAAELAQRRPPISSELPA